LVTTPDIELVIYVNLHGEGVDIDNEGIYSKRFGGFASPH
jgi:hypothetical protein